MAVDPHDVVWIDVVVPRGDPLWSEDVGVAFDWIGDAWVRALATLGIVGRRHRGDTVGAEAGRAVCFAGIGRGEVAVDGSKLVGLSQRRTREGARFQCMVHLRWRPDRWWPAVAAAFSPVEQDAVATRLAAVTSIEALSDDASLGGAADLVVAGLVSELLALP